MTIARRRHVCDVRAPPCWAALRLAHPLRTASAWVGRSIRWWRARVSLRVPETGARQGARLCQGARESVPGRHAADGRARGGVWPRGQGPTGVRGARYSSGPSVGRAGSGRARRSPSPMPRHAPRRMGGLEAGLPSEGRRGRKKLTPPEKASNLSGATGYNPLSFKKKCPRYLRAQRGCRAPACTAPQNSSQTTRTRASMQLKREIRLLCKEDAVLTSTFRRARIGTEVAVTSKRVCGADGVPHARS